MIALITAAVASRAEAGEPAASWMIGTAVPVAASGAALAVLGGLLALLGRRWLLAKFYSEGLLVMGLAATTLVALAAPAGTSAWHALISADTLGLLAALAVALLVSAMVFRQEDLFGFFAFVLLAAALLAFAVWVGPGADYLRRYQTVSLAVGILLAVASWPLASRFRGRPGLESFGAAAYVVAFAVAVAALALMPWTGRFVWRGWDLLAVALILAFIRPHVRHPATGYALAAAVVAAVFQFVAGRWGDTSARMHQASAIAAGAMSVALVLSAHLLRHVLLAFTHASDKEARRRSRPFTVVGMTLAVALAAYLSVQTALAYYRISTGRSPLPSLTATFTPGAAMLAWLGVLLAFLVSIWLFRHSARTFGFYLVGVAATLSVGPVLFDSRGPLLAFLICAVGGYGALHMLVYLWERPYMAMLSRVCDLYKDEHHASTTIFSAAVVTCFIGGILAAFHIHTTAAMVMLWILTVVFFVWSFGQRRGEFIYPTVLLSVGAWLSIWHNIEGAGPWTPERLMINALAFAAGAPIWMTVGTILNRLRGPKSLLNAPARQTSVIVALISLGFLAALALAPAVDGPPWRPDDSLLRILAGAGCGLMLTAFFLWAAHSFRWTMLVYLAEVALAVSALLVATRIPAVWTSPLLARWWPAGASGVALVLVGLGHMLERQRLVLYGRPTFYSAAFLWPLVALGGIVATAVRGDMFAAGSAAYALSVVLMLASVLRARRTLTAAGLAAAVLGFAFWMVGPVEEGSPLRILAPAAAALAVTGSVLLRHRK